VPRSRHSPRASKKRRRHASARPAASQEPCRWSRSLRSRSSTERSSWMKRVAAFPVRKYCPHPRTTRLTSAMTTRRSWGSAREGSAPGVECVPAASPAATATAAGGRRVSATAPRWDRSDAYGGGTREIEALASPREPDQPGLLRMPLEPQGEHGAHPLAGLLDRGPRLIITTIRLADESAQMRRAVRPDPIKDAEVDVVDPTPDGVRRPPPVVLSAQRRAFGIAALLLGVVGAFGWVAYRVAAPRVQRPPGPRREHRAPGWAGRRRRARITR
jgi:hypothetical protein